MERITTMEFNEKLQKLRKQKGQTQEELAEALYVSRTAISKWESGRGYPNIDSLKTIAKYFGVTIDELLSGGEALTIAEADNRQKEARFYDMAAGLMDIGAVLLFFFPLFRENTAAGLNAASLLALSGIEKYLLAAYYAAVVGLMLSGALRLTLRGCSHPAWERCKSKLSLGLNLAGTLLFIISLQPYAASLLFIFLVIKLLIPLKK